MCGIAGFAGHLADAEATLSAMAARLEHRGPDERGLHVEDMVGLAIRRLSIIGVASGRQPYRNESGRITAVFNGEIYGFAALRARLERSGHRFAGDADGEVIVHAYEQFGDRFLEHIDGMFAIALWDQDRRRLVLARDRLGKKPLHVAYHDDGGLSFASEPHALLADGRVKRKPDLDSIAKFLRLGYVPAPSSAFTGVRKLPPASYLAWSPDGVTEQRYWTLNYGPKLGIGYRDAVDELDARIAAAVEARLISEVPLGAFLSGGRDSSYVVAHMVRATPLPVRTFSIGFADARYDERPFARAVAEHLGTDHHEELVSADDLSVVLPELVRHYGEPFADSSAVPSFYLARMARHHITVALTGDGGDELLGGYDRHLAARLAGPFDALPSSLRSALTSVGARLTPRGHDGKSRATKVHRFIRALELDPDERFDDWAGMLTRAEVRALAPDLPPADLDPLLTDAAGALDRALATDTGHYLPDDLLTKIDIATMACSLEARSPLLDYRLVEWAARLPSSYKQRGLRRKRLLGDALARHVPRRLFERPKMGFAIPIAGWLRGELRDLLEDTLLDSQALHRGYAERGELERLLREHLTGSRDHSRALWALLVLELWHREFISVPGPEPVVRS